MVDDAELLRRYADTRSEEAFTALVERHLSLVYHAAFRRIGQAQLAEDATQYVFIALARNASALSRHAVLAGWLYTTTRFAAQRILRVERRRQLREQEAYAMQTAPSPSDPDWERLRPALDGVMDQLSDRDRAAVLLRYFEERSFADVGRILELTEEAARKRVERSVEKLRSLLARRGIASTSAALAAMLSSQAGLAAPAGLASAVSGTALAAGGVVSAWSVLGLAAIMSTTKSIMGAACIIALLALGTIGYEYGAGHRAKALLADETEELDLQSKDLRALAPQALVAENAATELKKSVAEFRTARAAAVFPAQTDPVAAGRKFLETHPEARPLLEKYVKIFVIQSYGPFLQSLALSPNQIEQIENNLAGTVPVEIPTPAGMVEISLDGPARPRGERAGGLRQIFGDVIYRQYLDYINRRRTAAGSPPLP